MKKELFSIRDKIPYFKVFQRMSVSKRNEEKQILIKNKPVYLGLSILGIK